MTIHRSDKQNATQVHAGPASAHDADPVRPMTSSDDECFDVIAVDNAAAHQSQWRLVGRYPGLPLALRARVEDVLALLVINDGWLIRAEHLIVGPGMRGPATVSAYVSEIGADPASDRVPDPFDLEGSRRWLLHAHGLDS